MIIRTHPQKRTIGVQFYKFVPIDLKGHGIKQYALGVLKFHLYFPSFVFEFMDKSQDFFVYTDVVLPDDSYHNKFSINDNQHTLPFHQNTNVGGNLCLTGFYYNEIIRELSFEENERDRKEYDIKSLINYFWTSVFEAPTDYLGCFTKWQTYDSITWQEIFQIFRI